MKDGNAGWGISYSGKAAQPGWYIPESLQAKYGMKVMPAGPDNPLGTT